MSERPIHHVIAVLDNGSNDEALYVGGELKDSDSTIYMCDLAKVTKGLVFEFSHVIVELPDGREWPERFEELFAFTQEIES